MAEGAVQNPPVGRHDELARLRGSFAAAASGAGGCTVVVGEAGLGKTRLVHALRDVLGEEHEWIEGGCLPESGVPMMPVRDALSAHLGLDPTEASEGRKKRLLQILRDASPDIIQMVPIIGGILGAGASLYQSHKRLEATDVPASPGDRDRHFEALWTLTAALAKPERPLVFFLDDLQWADSTTLAFFHYMARRIAGAPILLLATCRREELAGPAGEAILLMSREGLVERLPIEPLDVEATAALAEEALGAPVVDGLADELVKRTDGNPLFLLEALRMMQEEGALRANEDGAFQIQAGQALRMPPRVQDVLERRIQRLPRDERIVLQCAAVQGQRFEPHLVAKVLAEDPLKPLQILDEGVRGHALVEGDGEEGFAFTYRSTREYLLDTLSPALRREYHARFARLMDEAGPSSDDEVTRAGYHAMRGKQADLAVRWNVQAARRARARHAYGEALRLYQYALPFMEPGDEQRRIEEEAGLTAALSGDVNEAVRLLSNLVAVDLDVNDRARLLATIGHTWAQVGESRRANEAFQEMDPLMDDLEPTLRTRIVGLRSFHQAGFGNVEAALQMGAEALKILTFIKSSPESLLAAYALHGTVLCWTGKFRDALEAAEWSQVLHPKNPDPADVLRTHLNTGMALHGLGHWEDAEAELREGLQRAEAMGLGLFLRPFAKELAVLLAEMERLDEAKDLLQRLERMEPPINDAAETEYVRGRILLAEARWEDAQASFEAAVSDDRDDGRLLFVPHHLVALARAHLEADEPDAAVKVAQEAMDQGAQQPHVVAEAQHIVGLVHARRGDAEAAHAALTHAADGFRDLDMQRSLEEVTGALANLRVETDPVHGAVAP